MGRLFALLAAVLLPICNAQAGEALPRVIFPAAYELPRQAGGVITVDVAWLQVEVQHGWVVAAPRGAQFALVTDDPAGRTGALSVLRGPLTLIDLGSNVLSQLAVGSYGITSAGVAFSSGYANGQGAGLASGDEKENLAAGYRLSDAVMTQQQKYLDALKVDVRDINKGLASIIRGLFGRR